jgi:hypothetical protein
VCSPVGLRAVTVAAAQQVDQRLKRRDQPPVVAAGGAARCRTGTGRPQSSVQGHLACCRCRARRTVRGPSVHLGSSLSPPSWWVGFRRLRVVDGADCFDLHAHRKRTSLTGRHSRRGAYLSIAPIGLQRRKANYLLSNTYLAIVTISGSVGPVTTCATWAPPNELVGWAHSSDARTRVGAERRHDRRHLSGASLVTAHTRYLASADGVRVRAERLGALANPVEMVLAGSGHISDGRPAYGGQRKVKL